ncbi:MAG: vWA domain-containing protein, partial [Verrucomicrobiales bacterium]
MKTIPSFILLSFIAAASFGHAAPKLDVRCQTSNPALVAGKKQTTYIKVGLTGFERASESDRSPVNIALVLDRSGSMSGEKLQSAKDAARMAVRMLRSHDIFSLITYDSTVEVVVPATKVSDPQSILRAIDTIQVGGNTALFGGVAKGSGEVRKFLSKERVNSVILLSDGMANVGPSTANELVELGRSLIKEGISVTTLGYNEDLMIALANKSDGVHRFIQEPQQLVTFFKDEFGNVMNVVAQQIDVWIECAPTVRPIRVIGREADIAGQTVRLKLNQIYSKEEKYVLLEVETPAGEVGNQQALATISVNYDNLITAQKDLEQDIVTSRFVSTQEEMDLAVNDEVLLAAVTQIATETNRQAVTLRDEGKVQEAKALLDQNVDYLGTFNKRFGANAGFGQVNGINLIGRNLVSDDAKWNAQRKNMRAQQNYLNSSQTAEWPQEIQDQIDAELPSYWDTN